MEEEGEDAEGEEDDDDDNADGQRTKIKVEDGTTAASGLDKPAVAAVEDDGRYEPTGYALWLYTLQISLHDIDLSMLG